MAEKKDDATSQDTPPGSADAALSNLTMRMDTLEKRIAALEGLHNDLSDEITSRVTALEHRDADRLKDQSQRDAVVALQTDTPTGDQSTLHNRLADVERALFGSDWAREIETRANLAIESELAKI